MSYDRSVSACIDLLADLIGYRTVNPGSDELALRDRLAEELKKRGPDDIVVGEVERKSGTPSGYVFARYGTPRTVINVHLDTVPVNRGWNYDPFKATIEDGRLYGLGSADTKGAIAATLVALDAVRPRDFGIVFSGDEENGAECMRAFVASDHIAGIERALVCEPTARRAGVRHRGIRAYHAQVEGQGGHSSKADFMPKPVVTMAHLAIALDALGARYLDRGPDDMRGLCMNVASIDGGVAFNVIAQRAALSFSVRPPPGFDAAEFEAALAVCSREAAANAKPDQPIEMTSRFIAEPFMCRDQGWFERLLGDRPGDFGPLDFWTEAALWSANGVDAVVIGPGDIAQAHGPDEYVPVEDLEWAIEMFTHVLAHHAD